MVEKIIKVISNLKILSKMNEIIDGLNTHTTNTNNPHNVTVEQLGLATAYVYKGSVTNFSDLPANAQNGWVYSVENEHTDSSGVVHPAGANFAWDGSKWDDLGGSLSGYATIDFVENRVIPIEKGGTGATTVEQACINLDAIGYRSSIGSIKSIKGSFWADSHSGINMAELPSIVSDVDYWFLQLGMKSGDDKMQILCSAQNMYMRYSDDPNGSEKWTQNSWKLWPGQSTTEVIPIEKGGTGATTKATAQTNLGLNDAIVRLSVSGTTITYTQADGGTGTITTQDTTTPSSIKSKISVTAGTVAHNGTIPLPSGYSRSQCKYAVWCHNMPDADGAYNSAINGTSWHKVQVNQDTGVVYCKYQYDESHPADGTAGYLCIAVK